MKHPDWDKHFFLRAHPPLSYERPLLGNFKGRAFKAFLSAFKMAGQEDTGYYPSPPS